MSGEPDPGSPTGPPGDRHLPRRVLVRGSSMVPTLHDGDVVLARPGRPVRTGELALVRWPERPGQLSVKRLALPVDGGWFAVGDAPGRLDRLAHARARRGRRPGPVAPVAPSGGVCGRADARSSQPRASASSVSAVRRAAQDAAVGKGVRGPGVGQRGCGAVLVGEDELVGGAPLGPRQPERGVERVDAVLRAGVVGRRAQVGGRRAVGQGQEGVPEALGEIDRLQRLAVEADRVPAPEGVRAHPEVDDDVEQGAGGALHVLGLPGRDVGVVHAPEHPPAGYARVGLRHMQRVPDGPGEHLRLEGRGEGPRVNRGRPAG